MSQTRVRIACALSGLLIASTTAGGAQDRPWHRLPLHRWSVLAQMGRLSDAISVLRDSLAADTGSARLRADLGFLYYASGQEQAAIHEWREALARDSTLPDALDGIGNAFLDLDLVDSALVSHRRAVALDSTRSAALVNLGTALEHAGRYEEAEAAFRRSLASSPHAAMAWYNLGVTYYKMGRAGDAFDTFVRAAQVNEWYPDLFDILRSVAQEHQREFERAADSTNDVTVQVRLAYAYSYTGDWRKANRAMDRALTASPMHADLRAAKAWLLSRQDKHEDAIAAARDCPADHWFCRYVLGWSYTRTDPTRGVAVLTEAVRRYPDVVALQIALAGAESASGNPAGAAAALEVVERLGSVPAVVYQHLAIAYRDSKQYESAWRYARVAERRRAPQAEALINQLKRLAPEPQW